MQKKTDKELIDTKLAILPIGSVAQSLGIHQRTLRIYDKEGILSPTRSDKNRRNYSIDDLEKAKLVLFLTRNLALNLSGVKIILAILEENKIEPKDYLEYINKVAKLANIDKTIQKNNVEKSSNRGRKAKK